jgi:hypothetical protein
MLMYVNLVSFILRVRIVNFVRNCKNTIVFIANILLLLVIGANVLLVSFLLDYLNKNDRGLDIILTIEFINIFLFLFPLVNIFFPSIRFKNILFNHYDPISLLGKSFVELVYNLASKIFILEIISLIFLTIVSDTFSGFHFLTGVISIVSSSIFCLLVQQLITFNSKTWIKWTSVILIVCCIVVSIYYKNVGVALSLPMSFLAFALYYVLQMDSIDRVQKSADIKMDSEKMLGILLGIYLKTPSVIISFILSMMFKLTMLWMFLIKPQNFNYYFQLSVSSGLIVFTYTHNNIWGFLKTTFNSIAQRKDPFLLWKTYLTLLILPISCDLIITFSVIGFFGENVWRFLLFYFITLLCYCIIGFYGSTRQPFEVKAIVDFVKMKPNTPVSYNLLCGLVTIVIVVLFYFNFEYYASVCILILSIYFYWLLVKKKLIEDNRDIYSSMP